MMTKSINVVFSLLLILSISFSACKDDTTPAPPTPPCTDPGNLEVRVCDITQTNFFGAAEVYLYNTAAERDADVSRSNYLSKKLTDSANPNTTGAMFYNLTSKQYYFFAKWTNGINSFSGKGDSQVTTCKTTVVSCKVS